MPRRRNTPAGSRRITLDLEQKVTQGQPGGSERFSLRFCRYHGEDRLLSASLHDIPPPFLRTKGKGNLNLTMRKYSTPSLAGP